MKSAETAIIQAIDHHLTGMTEKELEMVLRFIHNLKDFREVKA